MLTDASNEELDRTNQKAQEYREQTNELGADRVQIPDAPYSLAAGDEVMFTKAMHVPEAKRVENGTRGTRSREQTQTYAIRCTSRHETISVSNAWMRERSSA